MQTDLFRRAAILGLLSAVGPFAIDMYLPAMPQIAEALETSEAGTQATLAAYFVCFGIAQLVYGPWSDAVGRRKPLLVGLAIFILGSIGAALAPSIGTLTAARALQGLGAAVVMVIPRAIIRDWFTGNEATRLMAMVMLVISVSPMLAPLAGSMVILAFDWRAIFVILGLAAVASLTLVLTALPETLQPERRVPVRFRTLLTGARRLLSDAKFMCLTFLGGFGMASFFVFIASASFVYTGQFGLSPTGFSVAFAVNAAGFFGASQFAAYLGTRFGATRVIAFAAAGFALATLTLLALVLAGFGTLPVIVIMLLLGNACLGLIIPTTMVLALDDQGDIAGLASSMGGTLQMLTGSAMIGLASPFFDGTALPMVTAIAVCGVAVFTLSRLVLRQSQLSPV